MKVSIIEDIVRNYSDVTESGLIQYKHMYQYYDTKVFVEYEDAKPEIVIAFRKNSW